MDKPWEISGYRFSIGWPIEYSFENTSVTPVLPVQSSTECNLTKSMEDLIETYQARTKPILIHHRPL